MSAEYYARLRQEKKRDSCHHEFEHLIRRCHTDKCKHCGVEIDKDWSKWYNTGVKHGKIQNQLERNRRVSI